MRGAYARKLIRGGALPCGVHLRGVRACTTRLDAPLKNDLARSYNARHLKTRMHCAYGDSTQRGDSQELVRTGSDDAKGSIQRS
jgi:hypothetical protein